MESMSSKEVRELFLKFFESKGHRRLPSASLVPNDPTLLLTGAGMNPFKSYFIGVEKLPAKRVVTCQKCLRTDDIENVGKTATHHTFFEMLGNFSFGDYFKEEAITWGWEFSIDYLKFPEDRIWISIYEDDDEAFEIWNKKIGVPAEKIVRLGEAENFWPASAPSKGPNGPCGPCTEMFFDMGEEYGCGSPDCQPGCDCERFKEYWNLVFQVFDRKDGGVLDPLPFKNIDTGLGFERVVSILQGGRTTFDTDLFLPIIRYMSQLCKRNYGENPRVDASLKIIADHIRAIAFLIADGVTPSNIGRGYVLRRILRRAALRGRELGMRKPFLDKLIPVIVNMMDDVYPELKEREVHICRLTNIEEDNFLRKLDTGIERLNEQMKMLRRQRKKEIPGEVAFTLYDTYGFPLDITKDMAEDAGFTVDIDGFEQEMEKQRERARQASESLTGTIFFHSPLYGEIFKAVGETEFLGYEQLSAEGKVKAIVKDEELVNIAREGDEVEIVLDRSPFYAEAGGQQGDRGEFVSSKAKLKIEDTYKPVEGLIVHHAKVIEGEIEVEDEVRAEVDSERRLALAQHHTATHLLHSALKQVLGPHANQSGSLVAEDRLRFDFTHFAALSEAELQEVERIANVKVRQDIPLTNYQSNYDEARSKGVIALFGEKYGDVVRVVEIGDFSQELCGGTHLRSTGQIGLIKIISEESIGAGIRRIEALAGEAAYNYVVERDNTLHRIEGEIQAMPQEVEARVDRLLAENKEQLKQIETLKSKLVTSEVDELISKAIDINGIKAVIAKVADQDAKGLRAMADRIRNKLKSGVAILASPTKDGRIIYVAMVTKDLTDKGLNAGSIIGQVARIASGGGGGRPEMAQAGGKDLSKLDESLKEAVNIIRII